MEKSYSPILLKFLKKYQDDPDSLVFAPLAEAFRKEGLIDDAIEICKEGLLKHPGYLSGQVALARCYFHKNEFDNVVELLKTVVEKAPDNALAARLLADSYAELEKFEEALKFYKLLLYYSPYDIDVSAKVSELEESLIKTKGLNTLVREESDDLKFNDPYASEEEVISKPSKYISELSENIGASAPEEKFDLAFTDTGEFVIRPARGALVLDSVNTREIKVKKLQNLLHKVQQYRMEKEKYVRNKPI